MKKCLSLCCAMIAILAFATGCGNTDESNSGKSSSGPVADLMSEEEARTQAAACYPEGVALVFEKLEEIDGKNCFVFTVTRDSDELLVSRAAVAASDGSTWFRAEGGSQWLPLQFFGDLTVAEEDMYVPGAYFELLPEHDENGRFVLYFSNVPDLPVISPANEGTAYWNPDERILEVHLTKVTGSLNGLPAGPGVHGIVRWVGSESAVDGMLYSPAPMFESPRDALDSNMTFEIEDEALIEIAALLRDKIIELETAGPAGV